MAYKGRYKGAEIDTLLDKVKESKDKVFVGTLEEYNSAFSEGLIPIGSLVVILDGSEGVNNTIALLGTAIIGKMILGKS